MHTHPKDNATYLKAILLITRLLYNLILSARQYQYQLYIVAWFLITNLSRFSYKIKIHHVHRSISSRAPPFHCTIASRQELPRCRAEVSSKLRTAHDSPLSHECVNDRRLLGHKTRVNELLKKNENYWLINYVIYSVSYYKII